MNENQYRFKQIDFKKKNVHRNYYSVQFFEEREYSCLWVRKQIYWTLFAIDGSWFHLYHNHIFFSRLDFSQSNQIKIFYSDLKFWFLAIQIWLLNTHIIFFIWTLKTIHKRRLFFCRLFPFIFYFPILFPPSPSLMQFWHGIKKNSCQTYGNYKRWRINTRSSRFFRLAKLFKSILFWFSSGIKIIFYNFPRKKFH